MDDTYQAYLNRIMRATLPDTYQAQVSHIQESPKFGRSGQVWVPQDFPGYTVITPPGLEDQANVGLYDSLASYQTKLVEQLGRDVFLPIPPESFHLTIADLIWDSAYRHAVEANQQFEANLQSGVALSFEQSGHLQSHQPIAFRVVGLIVMTRALGIALAAIDETGYRQILEVRRSIYQNPDLISIGIEQQYHFTPHITLGYFGDLKGVDREAFAIQLDGLNQRWIGTEQTFWVKQAELRQFPNMIEYRRQKDWATFEF